MEDRPVNIDSMAIPVYSPYLCIRNKEQSKKQYSLKFNYLIFKIMAEHMFRIVEKKTGEVIYYQGLVGCNKAKIVERAKKWCASHHFEGGDEAAKKHQIEFSYFTWDNFGKRSSRRSIGRSNYDCGWRCTTVCNLEQTNGHISIGSLIAGKALDPDTAKKAKGGAWGELMLAMGC